MGHLQFNDCADYSPLSPAEISCDITGSETLPIAECSRSELWYRALATLGGSELHLGGPLMTAANSIW